MSNSINKAHIDRTMAQAEQPRDVLMAAIDWVSVQTGNCRASADLHFANKARQLIHQIDQSDSEKSC